MSAALRLALLALAVCLVVVAGKKEEKNKDEARKPNNGPANPPRGWGAEPKEAPRWKAPPKTAQKDLPKDPRGRPAPPPTARGAPPPEDRGPPRGASKSQPGVADPRTRAAFPPKQQLGGPKPKTAPSAKVDPKKAAWQRPANAGRPGPRGSEGLSPWEAGGILGHQPHEQQFLMAVLEPLTPVNIEVPFTEEFEIKYVASREALMRQAAQLRAQRDKGLDMAKSKELNAETQTRTLKVLQEAGLIMPVDLCSYV